jgi:CheY-like chemotaxis protein
MPKRVLSVGQCSFDHAAINRMITSRFDAEVVPADSANETLRELRKKPVDLVLVNRKLDADYSDGLEIIKQIKADAELAKTPCMLVTNYPEYQEQAVAAGAELGFGKTQYGEPATLQRLSQFLA